MYFETLKDRMEYYKGLTDYKLIPNSYIICHVDGRSFSKKIKKLFRLPFDERFMGMMDECAAFACKSIQGCKLAYVQSDEISFVITDFENETNDSFFSYRICKMQSIIASLVTCKFQQLFIKLLLGNRTYGERCDTTYLIDENDINDIFSDDYTFQFDCKCWVVPEYNDVFAWLKYRQNDCIRNSKQQAAQTYCTYKELVRKNTDEQVEYLKEKEGIDWNTEYSDGEKYGRIIRHTSKTYHNNKGEEYERYKWESSPLKPLDRSMFDSFGIVPIREVIIYKSEDDTDN